MVKEHADGKGIRVMGHHVIRTRKYPYVVGCKIFIPESQQHIALNPDTWPENVQCRIWEISPSWRKRNNYSDNYDKYDSGDRYYDQNKEHY